MSGIRLQLCLRQKQKLEGFFVVVVKRLVGLLLFIVVLFCFLNKPKIFSPDFPSIACLTFVGSVAIFLIICIPYKFGIAVPGIPKGYTAFPGVLAAGCGRAWLAGRQTRARPCLPKDKICHVLPPYFYSSSQERGWIFFPHLHVQLGDKALLILVTQLEELPCLFEHLHLHLFQRSRSAGRRSSRSHLTLLGPLLVCFPVHVSQARTPPLLHLVRAFSPRAGANGRAVGQETESPVKRHPLLLTTASPSYTPCWWLIFSTCVCYPAESWGFGTQRGGRGTCWTPHRHNWACHTAVTLRAVC